MKKIEYIQPEPWPGRFVVQAKIDRFLHKGIYFKDVVFFFAHEQMLDSEKNALVESLGYTKEMKEDSKLVLQVEETFSEEQALELISYLEIFENIEAWMLPAEKPIKNLAPLVLILDYDYFHLKEQKDYDLSINVDVYYNTDNHEPIGKISKEGNFLEFDPLEIKRKKIENITHLLQEMSWDKLIQIEKYVVLKNWRS